VKAFYGDGEDQTLHCCYCFSIRDVFFRSFLQGTIFKCLIIIFLFLYCLCTYVPVQKFYFIRGSEPFKVNRNASIDADELD